MAKRFFYICAGILCLAFAYHLGASSATAQGGVTGSVRFVEAWENRVWIVNDRNDIFVIDSDKLRDVAKGQGWARFNLEAVR
jgi:hypothetical protein